MMIYGQAGFVSRATLFVLLGIGAFLALAVMVLPKGFSDDLSKVGQGMPAVVLIHDKNSVGSLNLMSLLGKVRSDYADKLEFVVVNIDSAEGQMFREQQNIAGIVAVLFDSNGTKLGTYGNTKDERELRFLLDKLSLE